MSNHDNNSSSKTFPQQVIEFLIESYGADKGVDLSNFSTAFHRETGTSKQAINSWLSGKTIAFKKNVVRERLAGFWGKVIPEIQSEWFAVADLNSFQEFLTYAKSKSLLDNRVAEALGQPKLHRVFIPNVELPLYDKGSKDNIKQFCNKTFFVYRKAFDNSGKISCEIMQTTCDSSLLKFEFRFFYKVQHNLHLQRARGVMLPLPRANFFVSLSETENVDQIRPRSMVIKHEDEDSEINKWRYGQMLSLTPTSYAFSFEPCTCAVVLELSEEDFDETNFEHHSRVQIISASEFNHPNKKLILKYIENDLRENGEIHHTLTDEFNFDFTKNLI